MKGQKTHGPEDVDHGGPGKAAIEEQGYYGIAQGGLPEAALVEPGELKPCMTQIHKRARESTCWPHSRTGAEGRGPSSGRKKTLTSKAIPNHQRKDQMDFRYRAPEPKN